MSTTSLAPALAPTAPPAVPTYESIIDFMKAMPSRVIPEGCIDDAFKIMNGEFAMVPVGGTPIVVHRYIETRDGRTRNAERYLKPAAFRDLLEHVCVKVQRGDRTVAEPIAELWLKWADRQQFAGIGFYPGGEPDGHLNIWRGFTVEPREGDWSLLRDHVWINICNGNERDFRWFMSWMAQIVQQPEKKLGTAVVLRGAKGTGKSKVFDWFGTLLGRHAFTATLAEHIAGCKLLQRGQDASIVWLRQP